MRRALLLVFALGACIDEGEARRAVDAYCALDEHKPCTEGAADTGCCPGFVCVQAECRKLTPGTCLFPDAGRVIARDHDCGCTGDCSSTLQCTDSKCQ